MHGYLEFILHSLWNDRSFFLITPAISLTPVVNHSDLGISSDTFYSSTRSTAAEWHVDAETFMSQTWGCPAVPALQDQKDHLQKMSPHFRGIRDWHLWHFKVFGDKCVVCHSQPSQLQMRCFWWLEHPRSCRAMGTTSPCVHASPLLFLKPPPCCSNESLVEGFPRAGFIELCYRKIQLRQPRRSQNNLSFLILPVTSLGA